MIIITDGNGNVVNTIPENVYQGSNNANTLVLLAPFASNCQVTVSFLLANGDTIAEQRMTNFATNPLPTNLEANAWTLDLKWAITQYYGTVELQFNVTNDSQTICSIGCSFEVLKGVAPILPATPTQTIYEQILEALANLEADFVNGMYESRALLPYSDTFSYSLGAFLYSDGTFYISLVSDNLGNALSDTSKWSRIDVPTLTAVEELISEHNTSGTAHADIRLLITNIINGTTPVVEADHATTADSATIADTATTADSATNATNDGSGNNIETTYQTKANLVTTFGETLSDTKYPSEKLVKDNLDGKEDSLGYTPENVANKDANNGYCPLDSGGKVPLSNLPSTLLKYIGTWNATTNTPTLTSPDTTKTGNVYIVSVAGTQFGISWGVGDWLIYNASGIPEKSDNTDSVVSVNSQTGIVELTANDIPYDITDTVKDKIDELQGYTDTMLTQISNVIYIDGAIGNDTNSGNVNAPVKTIAGAITLANTLTGATGFEIHIAQGTYTESGDITLPNKPIVIYGNNATISNSGHTITIPNPYFIRYNLFTISNVVYDNFTAGARCVVQGGGITGNVTINSYVEMLTCQLTGGTVTVGATGQLLCTICSPTSIFVSAGSLFLDRVNINTEKTSYLINSTGGQLTVSNSLITNLSTGGCIHCENGATTTPNILANNFIVAVSGNTVLAGTAYTIYSKNYVAGTAPSGSVFLPVNSDITGAGNIMALGSDATGDLYINVSGKLTRLPLGTNLQSLTSNGTLPTWTTLNTTYTTILPITSGGTSDWQAVTGGYELAKTITGLTVYDSIVAVASDDTIWTTNELNATITANTLTFFVSSLPSAEVTLTYTITKSVNGGSI